MNTLFFVAFVAGLAALIFFIPRKKRPAIASPPANPAKRITRLRAEDATESFFCAVVGESFKNEDGGDRQEIIRRLAKAGEQVHLEREPDNPHDDNAIAVFVEDQQIGYLKTEVAARHAPKIDTGRYALAAVIASVNGGKRGKKNLGVTLEATLYRVRQP